MERRSPPRRAGQARNPQPETLNPEPRACTLNPKPLAGSPCAETKECAPPAGPNSQPATLNPQPSTLKPKPSTLNPTPSTLNPTPSILNPQPSTLNPPPPADPMSSATLAWRAWSRTAAVFVQVRSHNLQPAPYTPHPTPQTPNPKPPGRRRGGLYPSESSEHSKTSFPAFVVRANWSRLQLDRFNRRVHYDLPRPFCVSVLVTCLAARFGGLVTCLSLVSPVSLNADGGGMPRREVFQRCVVSPATPRRRAGFCLAEPGTRLHKKLTSELLQVKKHAGAQMTSLLRVAPSTLTSRPNRWFYLDRPPNN